MTRRPIEPLLWLTFSAGGVLSALIVPVVIVLFGLAFPLGWLDAARPRAPARARASSADADRALRLLSCSRSSTPRIASATRSTTGLQIKHLNELINPLCYGGAAIVSAIAAYVLWRIP